MCGKELAWLSSAFLRDMLIIRHMKWDPAAGDFHCRLVLDELVCVSA